MPKATWQLLVDWDNDGTFTGNGEDVTPNLISGNSQIGRDFPSQLTGNAVVGKLHAILHDPEGTYVFGNPSSTLSGSLLPGRKVQLKVTSPGTYTVWAGRLDTVKPRKSTGGRQEAVLTALGPLQQLAGQKVSIAIQSDIRTDEAVDTLLDAIGFGTDRALSTGQTTMTRWFADGINGLTALREVEATEAGFLHETRDGSIAFRDRHFRLQGTYTDSQATWTDSPTGSIVYAQIERSDPLESVFNDIRATVQEFSTGATTTLWVNPAATAGTSAPYLGASSTLTVFASYPNADSPTTAFAADLWVTPTGTTDFIVTTDEFGTGTVITGDIAVSVSKFAKSMKIAFSNTGTNNGYFQFMQARGVPLNRSNPVTVSEVDATSQTRYGTRSFLARDEAKFIPSQSEAQEWCQYNVALYKEPAAYLTVALNGVRSTAVQNEVFARDLNEKVTVIATGSAGLNQSGEYYVESIKHRFGNGGFFHEAVFTLSPASGLSGFWILGDSTLGTNTKLAY